MLIVFDNMTADIESNKKLSPIVTELFLRGWKLNNSLVFTSQSYFKVPKTIRLNPTHYFIMRIPNKRELQEIASNHSSDIDFKDFMKLHKDYTKECIACIQLHQIWDTKCVEVNDLSSGQYSIKKFKTSYKICMTIVTYVLL